MKKFSYLLFILPLLTMAQINVDNRWKNAINPIFENLDKSKIPSGMLLDYAMEFTELSAYNGKLIYKSICFRGTAIFCEIQT
uniref:hypothetical protein n=1 Tax=Flavobacterium sp. TaxID=239 RepID=UPI00404A3CDF